MLLKVVLPAVLLTLSACAAPSVEDLPPELRESSIVAVQNPSVRLSLARTFSWMKGARTIHDPRLDMARVDRVIRDAIEDALGEKGLSPAPSGLGDVLVGYVAALEGSLDDATLDRLFRVRSGGLPRSDKPRSYEKGMLVVHIGDPKTRLAIWRGSVQIRASLDLPDGVRRKRVRIFVRQLFTRLRLRR